MSVRLASSVFTLFEEHQTRSAVDLWSEISSDLQDAVPGRYKSLAGRRYRLLITAAADQSPDRRYVRYRTVNAGIRLKRDAPALMDISLGNWVFETAAPSLPVSTAEIGDTRWVRASTSIPLAEHIRWISEFVMDLEEAGWVLVESDLTRLTLDVPRIETGGGVSSYDPSSVVRIASRPVFTPRSPQIGVLVLGSGRAATDIADRLADAWQRLFRRPAPPIASGIHVPIDAASSATLVVIADGIDLAARADLKALLFEWEAAGRKFKLSKYSSTTKPYPLQNLCFDLSVLAGSMPWRPVGEPRQCVSFDAGHDVLNCRSRWASACVDGNLQVVTLNTLDTALAEHMPDEAVEAFWPTGQDVTVFRDGRLARERAALDLRAKRENRTLWEVKKHPTALLYRGTLDQPLGANYADAAIDPHGEILLQTLPHGKGDCIHPIRVNLCGAQGDATKLTSELLVQTAAPSLSIYQQPRLPGVVYWADLGSKLDRSGWTQVIGRGFKLHRVIPQ